MHGQLDGTPVWLAGWLDGKGGCSPAQQAQPCNAPSNIRGACPSASLRLGPCDTLPPPLHCHAAGLDRAQGPALRQRHRRRLHVPHVHAGLWQSCSLRLLPALPGRALRQLRQRRQQVLGLCEGLRRVCRGSRLLRPLPDRGLHCLRQRRRQVLGLRPGVHSCRRHLRPVSLPRPPSFLARLL